jgi:hypothetical protein
MSPRRPKSTRRKSKRAGPAPTRRRRPAGQAEGGEVTNLAETVRAHPETSPRLTGGDVDADWQTAYSSGDEAVGGSVSTPDQDVVDELGEALGVGQAPDAEVRTAQEILRERDRDRWRLERESEDAGKDRP